MARFLRKIRIPENGSLVCSAGGALTATYSYEQTTGQIKKVVYDFSSGIANGSLGVISSGVSPETFVVSTGISGTGVTRAYTYPETAKTLNGATLGSPTNAANALTYPIFDGKLQVWGSGLGNVKTINSISVYYER